MADRQQIRQTLVQFLESDIGESFADLEDSKKIREDLGLDSVDVVSVVSQVERHFRIRLTEQELMNLATVGQLLDLLEKKITTPLKAAA